MSTAILGLLLVGVAFFAYRLFDFKVFWEAGRHLLAGQRIYPSRAALDLDTRAYFIYPPVVAMAFAPFSLLPLPVAATIYVLLALLAIGATLRVLGVDDPRCYLALVFWMPLLQAVGLGTIAPFLGLGLAIAWKHRDSRLAMPFSLALVVSAKLFLWPLLLWLLATRRWRAAGAFVMASAALILVPWALLDFRDLGWYPHALRLLLQHEQSLGFSTSEALRALHLGAATAVIQLASVFLIFWLARRSDGDRRSFSAAVIGALVLSPLVWIHYFAVLVVPIALARRRFSGLWILPAVAFWPPPNNLGHSAVALGIFAALTTAGALTLRPSSRRVDPAVGM